MRQHVHVFGAPRSALLAGHVAVLLCAALAAPSAAGDEQSTTVSDPASGDVGAMETSSRNVRHDEHAQHTDHGQHEEHAQHTDDGQHEEHAQHTDEEPHEEHARGAGHGQHEGQMDARAEHAEHHDVRAPPTPSFELPTPTPEERAAAFPELGEMDTRHTMHDDPFMTFLLLDQLEVGDRRQGSVLHWDMKAWAGRDLRKLWVRSRGEHHDGSAQHAELEVLWGRALGPWWDWVAGVKHDFRPGPSRTWAALGIQGLAPYWFELEGTLYLGEGGRAAASFEAEYELLVTNRLIFQPVFKLAWHSEDDPERGIGSGLGSAEGGLRLRYEIRREVAPYVGVVRERRFGRGADLARAAGAPARETWLVAGIRLWF